MLAGVKNITDGAVRGIRGLAFWWFQCWTVQYLVRSPSGGQASPRECRRRLHALNSSTGEQGNVRKMVIVLEIILCGPNH